jgi:hypothetical protein
MCPPVIDYWPTMLFGQKAGQMLYCPRDRGKKNTWYIHLVDQEIILIS